MKLSGYTVTRDCIQGDYCVVECVRSLAEICDEVVVCDAMSIDDTRDRIKAHVPWVRFIDYPREEPFGDREFLCRWINYAREQLHGDMQLYLDADEVLLSENRTHVRHLASTGQCFWSPRLNFWGDHRHYAPGGVVCGNKVVRLAPTMYWMPSDEPRTPEPECRVYAIHGGPTVFHYGFIRHADGFLKKSSWFQPALVGDFDKRLKRAQDTGEDWRILAPCPATPVPYAGPHPRVAHNWLRERGYTP